MKAKLFMPLTALLACACGSKATGTGEDIVIEGESFSLVLQPVMPDDQADLFDSVGSLELRVTQADGSTSTHPLDGGDTAGGSAVLPPLDGATLTLSGSNGPRLILWGQTPPIDLAEGEHTQRISLAKVNAFGALEELPEGLSFGAMAASTDGRFYIFGGADQGILDQTSEAGIYELDLGNPREVLRASRLSVDLPAISETTTGRMGMTATALTDAGPLAGQILITGGAGRYMTQISASTYSWAVDTQSTKQAFLFDPDAQTLTGLSSEMHLNRYGHVAVENHRGDVVIIGGFIDDSSTWSAFSNAYPEVFDPESQTFTQMGDLWTSGSAFHAAARLGKQGVMACGGVDYQMDAATECGLLSTDGTYSTVRAPGDPVLSPAMVAMADGRILMTGGLTITDESLPYFETDYQATDSAWVFQGGAWIAVAPMKHARAWHSALALPDGRVLISGGVTGVEDPNSGIYLGAFYAHHSAIPCAEIFDPDTDTFSQVDDCDTLAGTGSLPQPVMLQTGAVDPIHGAVLMGGISSSGEGSSSVMLYRPTPD